MQGIHEGTGAMLLPTLLVAVPSSVPVLVYCIRSQPKFSSMYPLHCRVLSLLPVLPAFLSNCLAIRHKVLSKSKRSYWGGFFSQMCICVCVFFFSPVYERWCIMSLLFSQLYVCSRLHVWMHNTTTQTDCSVLTSLILFICWRICSFIAIFFSHQRSFLYKMLLNVPSNTAHFI